MGMAAVADACKEMDNLDFKGFCIRKISRKKLRMAKAIPAYRITGKKAVAAMKASMRLRFCSLIKDRVTDMDKSMNVRNRGSVIAPVKSAIIIGETINSNGAIRLTEMWLVKL